MTNTEQNAAETVKLVYEGKQLTKYIPKGESPKLYIDLIKAQVMKPGKDNKPRSDADLLLFLYVAKRTGLDPLTKQIYAIFRWNSQLGQEVMSIQAGIDGMRLTAQRTGAYMGQDDVIFTPDDETLPNPVKATVTVYKLINGEKCAFTASARWSEYAVMRMNKTTNTLEPENMWKKMPYTMLGKCAEALALRKGFPNELSGVYSEEEMQQALPNEVHEIANLPKPERVKKQEEPSNQIVVEHGAPTDMSQTPKVVTPENIDQFADKLMGDSDFTGTVTEIPQMAVDVPNLAAMRAEIKPAPTTDEEEDAALKERQRLALVRAEEIAKQNKNVQ